MKIALAQLQSAKGDIEKNISRHQAFIQTAINNKADAIFFPELSVTGYEPGLAKELATTPDDERLSVFQSLSNDSNLVIGVGLPAKSDSGIYISLIIFQPQAPRKIYSKQYLHEDELPYFIPGNKQLYITIDNSKIAFAICYESLLPQHAEAAGCQGTDIYLASVAKSANGVTKGYRHYPEIAKRHAMTVLMTNCVGYCDNFQSAGSSSVWNQEGELVRSLDERSEGLLVYDTERKQAIIVYQAESTGM